jgi:hypothetical protein
MIRASGSHPQPAYQGQNVLALFWASSGFVLGFVGLRFGLHRASFWASSGFVLGFIGLHFGLPDESKLVCHMSEKQEKQ